MKTFLFTFNSKLWGWDDFLYGRDEMSNEISKMGMSICKWTCGKNKSIKKGDRIFLMQLGREDRGIIASGYAITDVFQGRHYNKEITDDVSNRVYVQFDKIIKDGEAILPLDKLNEISNTMRWTPQISGIGIPEDTAEKLEKEWVNYSCVLSVI